MQRGRASYRPNEVDVLKALLCFHGCWPRQRLLAEDFGPHIPCRAGLVPALGDHKGRPYDAGCENANKLHVPGRKPAHEIQLMDRV